MDLRDFIQKEVPDENESKRKSLDKKAKKISIYDIINAATKDKKDLDFSNPDIDNSYDQFMVNRWLSMDESLIFLSEMLTTMHNLTNEQHFDLIKSALPQEKFYIKYMKKQKDLNLKEIKYIADYFELGLKDANTYISQMSDDEINSILDLYKYGEDEIVKM